MCDQVDVDATDQYETELGLPSPDCRVGVGRDQMVVRQHADSLAAGCNGHRERREADLDRLAGLGATRPVRRPVAPSWFQVLLERQRPAAGHVLPPSFGALRPPCCSGQRTPLAGGASPLGLRQHVAVQRLGELAGHIRVK